MINSKGMTGIDKVLAMVLMLLVVVSIGIMLFNIDLTGKLGILPSWIASGEVTISNETIESKYGCNASYGLDAPNEKNDKLRIVTRKIGRKGSISLMERTDLVFKTIEAGNHEIHTYYLTKDGENINLDTKVATINKGIVTVEPSLLEMKSFRDKFVIMKYPPRYSDVFELNQTIFKENMGLAFCKEFDLDFDEGPDPQFISFILDLGGWGNDQVQILEPLVFPLEIEVKENGNAGKVVVFKDGEVIKGSDYANKISKKNTEYLIELSQVSDPVKLTGEILDLFKEHEDFFYYHRIAWKRPTEEFFSVWIYGVPDMKEYLANPEESDLLEISI